MKSTPKRSLRPRLLAGGVAAVMSVVAIAIQATPSLAFEAPKSVTIVTGATATAKFGGTSALMGPLSDVSGSRFKARPAANSKERIQVLAAGK